MDMIQNHFEQAALSAAAISELPFPKSKIFTNALLQPHDITALIRDTELHERALFTAAVPEPTSSRKSLAPATVSGEGSLANLKPHAAVGRILGNDLQRRIRRSERAKGEVDVDLLLEGAERLCAAYPIPGVLEKISALRSRHQRLISSVALYEERLADQSEEMQKLSHHHGGFEEDDANLYTPPENLANLTATPARASIEDEESELKHLEEKKRGLEDRVNGLDRDLGGLRR